MFTEKLRKSTVGIAGCGGLGSNCAVALARIGIGKLIVADFDTVSESNLNRQYFFLSQIGHKKAFALKHNIGLINTNVAVEAHDVKLSPDSVVDLFENCDVIVEAFDLAEMKQMIIDTVLTHFPDKYMVVGSGLAGWGDNNTLKTEQYDNLFVCGDQQLEVSPERPPLAPRVGIVANMQANQVLDIIMNNLKF